ncbi:unnamed protein product [Caenorhabditis brenneri]
MLLKLVPIASVLSVLAQSAPLAIFHDTITHAYAVDLSAPVVLGDLQCMKQAGYNAAFVRAYNPSGQGSFDTNACNTIQSSYYAGLGNEIYMTPQPQSNKQGYQQLDEVYQGLNQCGTNIRSIWIQVTSRNNWLNSPADNVNFINSIVNRAYVSSG